MSKEIKGFQKGHKINLGKTSSLKNYLVQEILKILPEKRSMIDSELECFCDGLDYCDCDYSRNDGFNECLEEINLKLGKS